MNNFRLPNVDTSNEDRLLQFLAKQNLSDSHFAWVINTAITAKTTVSIGFDNPNQSLDEFFKKFDSLTGNHSFGTWQSTPWRIRTKDLETEIISKVCQKTLSLKDKIIEVGAGELENGRSYLMQLIPANLRHNITPTDLVSKSPTLKQVDLCQLDKAYKPSSLDKIIGSSVLDTLNNQDLTIACKQIYAALKPEGLLLHFANLSPFDNTFISNYREDSHICFPWMDGEYFIGLLRIEKKKLLDFISNMRIKSFAKQFLSWYSNLTVSEREITLTELTSSPAKNCVNFSNWIKEIIPDGLEQIDKIEFYENRTKNALATVGFEIVEFGCERSARHTRDRIEGDDLNNNYFTVKWGQLKASKIHVLLEEKVHYSVNMHVIIAKKK